MTLYYKEMQMYNYFKHAGVSLYFEGIGQVQNNSIVQLSRTGSIGKLQCISASMSDGVGKFIAPNGTDITNDSSIITIGNITDPGYISLELQDIVATNQGIYRCVIPDEDGDQQTLHVGVSYGPFNGMLVLFSPFYLGRG